MKNKIFLFAVFACAILLILAVLGVPWAPLWLAGAVMALCVNGFIFLPLFCVFMLNTSCGKDVYYDKNRRPVAVVGPSVAPTPGVDASPTPAPGSTPPSTEINFPELQTDDGSKVEICECSVPKKKHKKKVPKCESDEDDEDKKGESA